MARRGILPRHQHRRILELLRTTATHAHEVVVVAVGIGGQFVAPPSLRQLQFLEQPHGTQQSQGAIHRGQGHLLLLGQQPLVHLLSTEMAAGTALLEQGEHALALGREPLAAVVQRAAQGIAGHRGGQG